MHDQDKIWEVETRATEEFTRYYRVKARNKREAFEKIRANNSPDVVEGGATPRGRLREVYLQGKLAKDQRM